MPHLNEATTRQTLDTLAAPQAWTKQKETLYTNALRAMAIYYPAGDYPEHLLARVRAANNNRMRWEP